MDNGKQGDLRAKLEAERRERTKSATSVSGQKIAEPLDVSEPKWIFSEKYVRIDLDTTLESVLFYVSGFFFLFALPFSQNMESVDYEQTFYFATLALAVMVIKIFTDFTYVLDNENRRLLYSRTFLGLTRVWKVCDFDDIGSVGGCTRRKRNLKKWGHGSDLEKYFYSYATTLRTLDLKTIRLTDFTYNYDETRDFSQSLASHLGVPFERIAVSREQGDKGSFSLPLTPAEADWRPASIVGNPGFLDLVIAMLSATLSVFSLTTG